MYAFFNNEFLPAEKTFVHISDLSLQRGYGVFDFFKIVRGRIPFMEDYLQRFYQSAEQMQLPVPLPEDPLKEIIFELIKRNGMENAGIKLLLTGGYSADGYTIESPNLVITQHVVSPVAEKILKEGVKIITHEFRREMPLVKSINYTTGIWLQRSVKEQHAYDVLYHLNGEVTEFPRCNLFIVNNKGEVITPGENVLQGITRKNVLALNGDIAISTGKLTLTDVLDAREAFLTSTTKRIVPIVQVEEQIIGTGRPGQVTRELAKRLLEKENMY